MGENVREEYETLMLLNMFFRPEIGTTSAARLDVPEISTTRSVEPEFGSTIGSKIGSIVVEPELERTSESAADLAPQLETNNGKFGKNLVYLTREKKVIPNFVHVQEFDPLPPPLHEVTLFNPINNSNDYVVEISEVHEDQNLDLDLPIALRKGTKTCTQQPIYLLSNFISFKKALPTHKTFLTNLNIIHTPSSISEALSE